MRAGYGRDEMVEYRFELSGVPDVSGVPEEGETEYAYLSGTADDDVVLEGWGLHLVR